MRGIVIGIAISVILWLLIAAASLHQSVTAELGRRAGTEIGREITACLSVEWKSELCEDLLATWDIGS